MIVPFLRSKQCAKHDHYHGNAIYPCHVEMTGKSEDLCFPFFTWVKQFNLCHFLLRAFMILYVFRLPKSTNVQTFPSADHRSRGDKLDKYRIIQHLGGLTMDRLSSSLSHFSGGFLQLWPELPVISAEIISYNHIYRMYILSHIYQL
jgi:hypothetical protein